jgi:hypothetical protein
MAGAFWSWFPVPVESPQDTALMRASLRNIEPDDFSGSFVSPQDHSPVRRVHSDRLVTNVTAAALRYTEALMEAGRFSEAHETLRWAQRFERKTVWGPVFATQIESLKTAARGKL